MHELGARHYIHLGRLGSLVKIDESYDLDVRASLFTATST
jgi:hypothetical protein